MTCPKKNRQKKVPVSADDIRVALENADWDAFSGRVAEKVARKAEKYKEASARSLEDASRRVFV